MFNEEIDAAVGMTRKWDAREAGREVARNTIKKLKTPPSFVILFSTIHYQKKGGFKQFLEGIYDVLPDNTPLIGGTVTGFMNNYGCFARGATCLAVSSSKIDAVVGYGKNTKRNPKKAAKQCSRMIEKPLLNSDFQNKFLLHLVSGSIMPNIPFIGQRKVVRSKISTKLLLKLFGFSEYFFQKGYGRDDEVVENMIKYLPNCKMLSGGTLDDGSAVENYQFFNKNVFTNSIVTLGISSNYDLDVNTTHNMKRTALTFNITKTSRDGRIIHEINNKPAVSEFLRLLNWSNDYLNEETWFKTNYYFPLGFRVEKDKDYFGPRLLGAIYGESFITLIRSKDKEAPLLTINGKRILETIERNLKSYSYEPKFGLVSSCCTRLETLGKESYKSYERITNFFGDRPFVVFYVGGESSYSPDKGLKYANMSFNTAIFGKKCN